MVFSLRQFPTSLAVITAFVGAITLTSPEVFAEANSPATSAHVTSNPAPVIIEQAVTDTHLSALRSGTVSTAFTTVTGTRQAPSVFPSSRIVHLVNTSSTNPAATRTASTTTTEDDSQPLSVLAPGTVGYGHGGNVPPSPLAVSTQPAAITASAADGGTGGILVDTADLSTTPATTPDPIPDPEIILVSEDAPTEPTAPEAGSNTGSESGSDMGDPPPPGEDPVNWGPENPDWWLYHVVP